MESFQSAMEHYNSATLGVTYDGKKRKITKTKNLPLLTSQVEMKSIFSSTEIGVREIRLDKIIGTFNEARSHSFTYDFIPKSNIKTEFANKWINLCAAQLKEGIREPIVVYEYLNYYYVQEGNKRVSVLK